MFGINYTNMSNFYPLVDQGGETKSQVGEY